MRRGEQAPAIGDYGLIGDCHGSALVSRQASIDWCCLPRVDSGSCFGRLLDWRNGGFCAVTLHGVGSYEGRSDYLRDTLVLQTTLEAQDATVSVLDFFAMRDHGAQNPPLELIRIVQVTRGAADVRVQVAPRFDYGTIRPWLRRWAASTFTAIGGDDGLLVCADRELDVEGDSLILAAKMQSQERLRLLLRFVRPHLLQDKRQVGIPDAAEIDVRLEETVKWWRRWRRRVHADGFDEPGVVRSALTLKALTYAPTGAIAAAPTTSLPEEIGGERNWDYRYSWVRDSSLAAHALAELGCLREAERFRHFIVRSSGGHAEDLQVLFGVGGERRIVEQQLALGGYRRSRPVRIGNTAALQLQLDAFGDILNIAWRWHMRGYSPDDDEWRFFVSLIETVVDRWREPDRGIWEWRGEPRHFVHSKATCWAAVDRGLRLAEECMRRAPTRRWRKARDEIRAAIERRGYDRKRGIFVQCFDEQQLDCALLLLPVSGFVAFDDERMIRTADAIRHELDADGLLYRYRGKDSLPGQEGAFIACSFWLAECYARQGRLTQALEVFDRARSTASPLGLYAEQADPRSGVLLGNYPLALTHLSHISAAVALSEADPRSQGEPQHAQRQSEHGAVRLV